MVDGGGLENVPDRLYQDGYIFAGNFMEHAQNVARLCAIFRISSQPLIIDPPNFARNSLI